MSLYKALEASKNLTLKSLHLTSALHVMTTLARLRHLEETETIMVYLPKAKLGEIVPFLEDVLRYDFENGWRRLRYKLEDLLPERYWDFF
jgi:hypothetical protein